MILNFAVPAALNGDGLEAEFAAAGWPNVDVSVTGDQLAIYAERLTETDRPGIAAVVAAHTGQPTAAQAAIVARASDATDALTRLIAQAGGTANVRAKLKAVLAGTDTFTPAQMQRLLAAVALAEIRDRSDT